MDENKDSPEQNAMRWYIVHTYSGYEDRVKESIEQRFAALDKGDLLGEVLVPTALSTELKGGRSVVTAKKLFPGYVYIRMSLTDESWHIVESTPRVTGFVGGRNPAPLSDDEINSILDQAHMAQEKAKPKLLFAAGDKIKIIDGPFNEFVGDIKEVNEEKKKLKVIVKIFGRGTEVELNFMQVEKQS